MKEKHWQNIFHVIVNANSIVQYAIQIKNRTMIHVNVNSTLLWKNVISGILVHVTVSKKNC